MTDTGLHDNIWGRVHDIMLIRVTQHIPQELVFRVPSQIWFQLQDRVEHRIYAQTREIKAALWENI